MKFFVVFLFLILGLNFVSKFFKTKNPLVYKNIIRFTIYSFALFFFLTILLFNGITVKGIYTYTLFGLIFLVGCVLYFVMTENSIKKLIWVVALIPTILLVVFLVFFGQVEYRTKLNNDYDIEVRNGGFMACGEHIYVTQTFFGIFRKRVKFLNGLCVIGINKILIEENNDTKFKLLIFHNKVMDSENPIKYELEMENKD